MEVAIRNVERDLIGARQARLRQLNEHNPNSTKDRAEQTAWAPLIYSDRLKLSRLLTVPPDPLREAIDAGGR